MNDRLLNMTPHGSLLDVSVWLLKKRPDLTTITF
jgi:hypothetical protein